MPAAKKISSSGAVYWLAYHSTWGLILFDKNDQNKLKHEERRIFCVNSKHCITIPLEELQSKTSDDVTDGDSLRALYGYRKYKMREERMIPNDVKAMHRKFLADKNVPNQGIRFSKTPKTERHRNTFCWQCKTNLDNNIDCECNSCDWIICGWCGACGCGH